MSLSRLDRRFFISGLLLVAACGYEPALAPGGPSARLLASVAVQAPGKDSEFDFVRELEQRLGRPQDPQYRLTYQIETRRDRLGAGAGKSSARYNVIGKVAYKVARADSGAVVARGSVDAFTGYSVAAVDASAPSPMTNADIATSAAAHDAERRLMVLLADLLFDRLVATYPDWGG